MNGVYCFNLNNYFAHIVKTVINNNCISQFLSKHIHIYIMYTLL